MIRTAGNRLTSIFFAFAGSCEKILTMSKIDQVNVDSFDRERAEVWFRTGSYVRRKNVRQPEAVVKAKSRLRTARWRTQNDQQRPESGVIAMALLRALVCSPALSRLTADESGIVTDALVDLHKQGYSIGETLSVCKRLRKRLIAQKAGKRSVNRSGSGKL
jgi:hypothetical protein